MTANSAVAERLRATLAKELKQDVSSITSEHTLRGDLKLNSLDAIELMFRIEEEFDLSIPDDDMQEFVKVGDVIDYLQRRVTGAVAGTPTPTTAIAPPPAPAAPKVAVAAPRATPAPKAAAKKAKTREARRRA